MPIKRVRSKKRSHELTEFQIIDLMFGYGFREYDGIFNSAEERKKLWDQFKNQIMDEYMKDKNPGDRPSAWWEYETPEKIKISELTREKEIELLRKWNMLEKWEKELLHKNI